MNKEFSALSPLQLRQACRTGMFSSPTAGFCPNYVQANLVIVDGAYADEYVEFLARNPKPCPVLELIRGGAQPISAKAAPGANIATDFPRYRVYRKGELVDEPADVSDLWTGDMVAALIGCSLTFEAKLAAAGIRMAHYEHNLRVPMYDTNIPCVPSGRFSGHYVVSMRPIPEELVDLAVEITRPMEYAHGAPVHIGDPAQIGISDLQHPDYGDPPQIKEGEVPVFWACGVTAQAVAMQARPELVIAHSPGYMLVTDIRLDTLD